MQPVCVYRSGGLRRHFRVQSCHSRRQDAVLYSSQDGCRYSPKRSLTHTGQCSRGGCAPGINETQKGSVVCSTDRWTHDYIQVLLAVRSLRSFAAEFIRSGSISYFKPSPSTSLQYPTLRSSSAF